MQIENCKAILEPIRLIYPNKDNTNNYSYYVYGCELISELEGNIKLNRYDNVTLCGIMPELELYKQYTVTMQEEYNKKYKGVQYVFVSLEKNLPKTQEEQIDYFNTLLTHLQVKNIFAIYEDPLKEFIEETFDYKKVKGFGEFTYNRVKKKIIENYVIFDLLSQLSKYGITYNQVLKLYDKYKNIQLILDKINDNPYILMELHGIAFEKADKIATNMGILPNDIRRINACIFFILDKEESKGHTWLHINSLETEVKKLTGAFDDNFLEIIEKNIDLVCIDNYKVSTFKAYNTELEIAKHLIRLKNGINIFKTKDFSHNIYESCNNFIKEQEKIQGFDYNDAQKQGYYNLVEYNVSGILGYAGTGKSVLINGILNYLDKQFINYVLFSPTAKACKVLRKYTGRDAFTYQRGLGWTPFGYKYNKENPLPVMILFGDETSMVGIYNFLDMLKALPDNTKLVLIGDTAQLESIEPGCVLDDIIKSNIFSFTELTEVHRQAQNSGIIEIATKIRLGELFISDNEREIKFFGVNKDAIIYPGRKEITMRNIIKSYKALLVRGFTPDDILVVLPMKKGESGIWLANQLLQELNNPKDNNKKEYIYSKKRERIYRENDKVINIQNDYNITNYDKNLESIDRTGIINGDMGNIYKIFQEKGDIFIAVEYEDFVVIYSEHDIDMLDHAWGTSIHKCQGGSFPAVIVGLDSRHSHMVKRSLAYTAATRPEQQLVICCEPYVLNKAILNNELIYKRTFLKDLLLENKI